MKKYFYLFVFAAVFCISSSGQSLGLATSNTPSICYNDGSLTIYPAGGTPPYTDSILSGPTNPNLTYPIALPTGQNVFTNLPHGTFLVVVHDAAGLSATDYAGVNGTYEFPTTTLSQNIYSDSYYGNIPTDTLNCIVTGGTGTAPFQYAISSTSANSGFSSYQSQSFFTGLCPGVYWVRVLDNCNNIYTNSFTMAYNLKTRPDCVNYANGDVTVDAAGGVPPYTYNIVNTQNNQVVASNHTGVFTSLPFSLTANVYTWNVSDECGEIAPGLYNLQSDWAGYGAPCPFTGSLEESTNYLNGHLFPFPPLTFTCLNCTPVQTVTFNTLPPNPTNIFTGLRADSTYIISEEDACGNIDTTSVLVKPTMILTLENISCRSVRVVATYTNGTLVPPADIDSFFIGYNGHGYWSTTGTYYDLPYTGGFIYPVVSSVNNNGCASSCNSTLSLDVFYFAETPDHGPQCQPVWNFTYPRYTNDPENLYFISPLNDTIFEQLQGNQNYFFPFLQPNTTYRVVSDSGCSQSVNVLAYPNITNTVASSVTCVGQPVITVTGNDPAEGPSAVYSLNIYHNNTLAFSANNVFYNELPFYNYSAVSYYPTDTGFYHYVMYRQVTTLVNHFTVNTIYDTICPQDSGTILVTDITVPFPYVNSAYLCAGLSPTPPALTIYGGSIPYTVEIPGVDTLTMNSNTTLFPTTHPGTYNVIAYDYCGVSRSFTFSIIDTCCATSLAVNNDTTICNGRSTNLSAYPTLTGGSFLWAPGGQTTQSITVSPTATTPYRVSYIQQGCLTLNDTTRVIVTPVPTVAIRDTAICIGTPVNLVATPSQGGGAYLWAPGGATTQNITVSPVGNATYTVTYNYLGCPPVIDSGHVTVSPLPVLTVHDTTNCAGWPVTLKVTPNEPGGTYLWAPGGATTRIITVSPTNNATYTVTYSIPGCAPVIDSGHVVVSPPPVLTVRDTVSCAGSPVTFTATPSATGGTYSWAPGSFNTPTITVSPTSNATYTVTYNYTGCLPVTDTGHVTVSPLPVLSVRDTSSCGGTPVGLNASTTRPGGSYNWAPGGATTQSITVSTITNATYTVTYVLAGCNTVTDSGHIIAVPVPVLAVTDTAVCGSSPVRLTTSPSQSGGVYHWANGATTQSINITPNASGTYLVTYTLQGCPPVVDSGHVTVVIPSTIALGDTTICANATVVLNPTVSQPGGTWLWAPGNATTQSISVSPSADTSYVVQYSIPPCAVISDTEVVSVLSAPINIMTYTDSGYVYQFNDSVTGGTGPFTYFWTFGDGGSSSLPNPWHIFNNKQANYTVTLIVSNACGSDTTRTVISVINGVADVSFGQHVSLYPNPNQGSFTIAVDGTWPGALSADITDMMGRSIYKQPIHTGQNQFNIELAAGTYLVKVSYGELSTVLMMVK